MNIWLQYFETNFVVMVLKKYALIYYEMHKRIIYAIFAFIASYSKINLVFLH